MKWKLEVNHKILIRLLVVLILLVIVYGIECAFFKPTALNRYIASNIYKTPANSSFHDDKFYQCVVDRYNSSNRTSIPYTTSLTDSQLKKITFLSCQEKSITDVSGLEKLTALKYVYFDSNQLTNLDVSKNTALKYLKASDNQLTNLNVGGATALTELYADNNQLTNLDVSKNTALEELRVFSNQLTNLDVSKNTALTYLNANNNQLTNLNVGGATALTELYADNNQLTNLNVGGATALTKLNVSYSGLSTLNVSGATDLTELDVGGNQLTNIDVSKNTALKKLDVGNNKLTNIDVSKNTALTELNVGINQLTNVDVSKNPALFYFKVSDNQLTNLNVSGATALMILWASDNQLTNLNVSDATALTSLWAFNNQLTNIDVSKNLALNDLRVYRNQLTNVDVSKNPALKSLKVGGNKLTNIDLSKNPALTELDVGDNQLTTLDLSNNLKLSGCEVVIHGNPLSKKISILLNSRFNIDKLVKLPPQISVREESEIISHGLQKSDDGFFGIKAGTQSIQKGYRICIRSYGETYTIEVVDVKSDKYLIDKSKGFIVVNNDTDEEVLKNIVVENGTATISENKLVIKNGNDVVKEFSLIRGISNKYNFNKNYVYVGSDSDSEVLNNITLESGLRAMIEKNKLLIVHGNVGVIASFDLVHLKSTRYDLSHEYICVGNESNDIILHGIEVTNSTVSIENMELVIKYQDEVVKKYGLVWVKSSKYDTSKNNLYIGKESVDDILGSIEVINGTAVVDGTELVIKHGDDVVKRYGLVQSKSSKYDMSKDYLYVGQDSNDVIINNIEANADIVIDDDRNILTLSYYNNVSFNYRLIRLKTKYDLSNHYLYTLDDNILDNIESGYVHIEDNRLVVRCDDEIVDVFPILTLTSDDYTITDDYIYSGYRNPDLDKIHLVNVDASIQGDNLMVSYQDDTVRRLPIYHLQSNRVVRFEDKNLYIKDSMDYTEFVNNVTFNSKNSSLRIELYRGENKVTTGNVIEGDTLKVFYQDKEVDSYTVCYRNEYVFYDDSASVMQTDTYGVDILKNLRVNDTFLEIKKLIETDGVISIKDKNNQVLEDNHLIKTGDRMEISFTSANSYLIYLSIRGDVTGSGSISDEDVLKSYQILRGEKVDRYIEASTDVVGDGVIKINDVAKLHQYVNKKIKSLED